MKIQTFKATIFGGLQAISVCLFMGQSAWAHEGHGWSSPWEACEEKVRRDSCAFENANKDIYRGTCQVMSEKLICVRNKPIEYHNDHKEG